MQRPPAPGGHVAEVGSRSVDVPASVHAWTPARSACAPSGDRYPGTLARSERSEAGGRSSVMEDGGDRHLLGFLGDLTYRFSDLSS